MGQRAIFADAQLDVEPRARRLSVEPDAETPFRIALLGDFRGRASRALRYGPDRLEGCRPWPVDKDDFQDLLDRVAPRIETQAGPLELRDLDDFHPDALYAEAPVFVELRRLRRLLRDPDSFRVTARELFSAVQPAATPPPPPSPPKSVDGGDVLDAILSGGAGGDLPEGAGPRESRPAAAPARDKEWKSLIHGIVAPHLIPKPDPRQEELLAQLDAAVAEQMRLTLHDPAFQQLEAAWRSVFLLLDRLETGVDLKIDLIDLSKAELLEDVSGEAIEASGMFRLLVDEAGAQLGADRWSVVACLHTFSGAAGEIRALQNLARIADAAGAPFVAGMSSEVVGCSRLDRNAEPACWSYKLDDPGAEAAWSELRAMPEAQWLALAMPRFLLRNPYGGEGSSTDLPGFEELSDRPEHEQLLWGSPAAACACLLGEAFMRSGWSLRPGALGMLDRRPVVHAGKGSDREMIPGAEVWLTDASVERLLERGLTPLVSIKGRDAIAIARLQSVALPPRPLRGAWNDS